MTPSINVVSDAVHPGDVVNGVAATILQLLASENQTLLIWRNSLLVLDLLLDVINRVRGLHVQSDGLASQGLHENLHVADLFEYGKKTSIE